METTKTRLPPLVYGTSAFGNLYRVLEPTEQAALVDAWMTHRESAAPELPIVIDTAGKYGAGLALENLGRQLKSRGLSPRDVLISNKLGWRRQPLSSSEPTFEKDVWVGLQHDARLDISYDGILRCHDEGCALLGDYTPQWVSVHDPDEYLATARTAADQAARWEDILDAYRALDELKARGVVTAVGVGAKDWTVIRELCRKRTLDWVIIANSLTVHDHPRSLLSFVAELADRGTLVLNSAVYNGGFLVGGEFYNYQRVTPDTEDGAAKLAWRKRFFDLCDQFNTTPAHACLQFGQSPSAIAAIAVSTTRARRIDEQWNALRTPCPPGFWQALRDDALIDMDDAFV